MKKKEIFFHYENNFGKVQYIFAPQEKILEQKGLKRMS